MVIEALGKLFQRVSSGAPNIAPLGEDMGRISGALIHIEAHGNLDHFPDSRNARWALLETASRRHLVEWRRSQSRFALTKAGQRLAARNSVTQGAWLQEFPQPRGKLTGRLVGAGVFVVFAGLGVAGLFYVGPLDSPFTEVIRTAAHMPHASMIHSTDIQPERTSCATCPILPKRHRPAARLNTPMAVSSDDPLMGPPSSATLRDGGWQRRGSASRPSAGGMFEPPTAAQPAGSGSQGRDAVGAEAGPSNPVVANDNAERPDAPDADMTSKDRDRTKIARHKHRGTAGRQRHDPSSAAIRTYEYQRYDSLSYAAGSFDSGRPMGRAFPQPWLFR
jgi:hypothetical protein